MLRISLLVVMVAACSKSTAEKVQDLGDRACECAKKLELNFSIDSIRAATDAKVSGINPAAECARSVVTDLVALAKEADVKAEVGGAVTRLGKCLLTSGALNTDAIGALKKLGY